MFFNRFRAISLISALAVTAASITTYIAMTTTAAPVAAIVIGLLACGTAVAVLFLFDGAPPQTVAQVLYDAEQTPASVVEQVSSSRAVL